MPRPRRVPALLHSPALVLIPGSVVGARPAAVVPEPVPADLAADFQLVLDKVRARKPLAGVTAASTCSTAAPDRRGGARGCAPRPAHASAHPAGRGLHHQDVHGRHGALARPRRGRLGLDDRLARWVPTWPGAAGITLRQMLAHTSGIHDYFRAPEYESLVFGRPRHHWTTRVILKLVRKPWFAPGTAYAYFEHELHPAGWLIRRVTVAIWPWRFGGAFWTRWSSTRRSSRATIDYRVAAHSYLWTGSGWAGLADGTRYRPNTSAATVADAAGAALSNALENRPLGPRAVWRQRAATGIPRRHGDRQRARAVRIGRASVQAADGRIAWGHGGSLRGSVSLLWHVPAERLTVTVLTNRGRVSLESVGAVLVRDTLRWLRDQPPPPVGVRRVREGSPADRSSGRRHAVIVGDGSP